MKKTTTLLTVILFLTLSFVSKAQQTTLSISGKVENNQKSAITAATIQLLKTADSSVIRTSATDESGHFAFKNLNAGQYLVKATGVGFKDEYSKPIEMTASSAAVNLPTITLQSKSGSLQEVTVISRKPMVEQKIDRMVVNVDAAVTNTGTNALEVLEKSPGVQIDKDGNISLKGKQGVVVMIDGRPAYLSGPELANMLKGMQASQLEQIEIMTNPPAKYDAAGNSGIINIKTKKNKVKGFNGSITAGVGQGFYFKTNESVNLNYRNNKVNLFGTYSFASNNSFQELHINRTYKNEDESTRAIFNQESLMKRRRLNNNLKIGADYYLDKKTTLGVVLSGFYNPESSNGSNTSYLKDPHGVTDSIVDATSYIKEVWKNASANLNMRHQFDSSGHELTADLDYIKYDATNNQDFTNSTLTENWIKKYDEKLKGDLPTKIDIYSAKVDYTKPLKNQAKLELGAKTSYVKTDNRANYFEYLDGEWQPDYRKTNYFNYEENINAAYINFNKQITKKLGMQTGLRYENTRYKGFEYGNPTRQDSSFDRSYSSWFPTIYFSYAANKSNQFAISYGRRIDRPDYESLNPFLFFIDKYTYGQGNPYLKPQYSQNIELTHIFKEVLTTTLNYSATKDMFVETFDQPDNQSEYNYATVVRQGNIGKRQNAGIAFNLQLPVKKWWTSMIYTNYNYSKFEGPVNGEMVKAEAGNVMVNMNNQFRFKKGWSGEISGWYRSKGVEGQLTIEPMGQLSAGIAKQVLKGKGSVKLNARDIFYTQVAKGYINFKSTEATFRNTRDSRIINLTFSYRFGKPINGNTPKKRESSPEEKSRVKSGD